MADSHSAAELAEHALAALRTLLARNDVTGTKAAVVGFSLGGGAAATLATELAPDQVSALVLYYDARPTLPWDDVRAPVLNNYAARDAYNTRADETAVRVALAKAGARSQTFVYPATHHWFAEPSRPEYDRVAAALAFRRTLAWIRAARWG